MSNIKNQFVIAAEAFEKLREIVRNTPCSDENQWAIEAEIAMAELEEELVALGLWGVDSRPSRDRLQAAVIITKGVK